MFIVLIIFIFHFLFLAKFKNVDMTWYLIILHFLFQIRDIRMKNGVMQHLLEYIDYPDQSMFKFLVKIVA